MIGLAAEIVYGLFQVTAEPRMTRFVAAQLSKSHYFNTGAARVDFGFVPQVPTGEGVRRLLESLSGN